MKPHELIIPPIGADGVGDSRTAGAQAPISRLSLL
jgi:hypothetical protein